MGIPSEPRIDIEIWFGISDYLVVSMNGTWHFRSIQTHRFDGENDQAREITSIIRTSNLEVSTIAYTSHLFGAKLYPRNATHNNIHEIYVMSLQLRICRWVDDRSKTKQEHMNDE